MAGRRALGAWAIGPLYSLLLHEPHLHEGVERGKKGQKRGEKVGKSGKEGALREHRED